MQNQLKSNERPLRKLKKFGRKLPKGFFAPKIWDIALFAASIN